MADIITLRDVIAAAACTDLSQLTLDILPRRQTTAADCRLKYAGRKKNEKLIVPIRTRIRVRQ